MDAKTLYTDLRKRGEVTIEAWDIGVVAGVRRLAKADGLQVVQARSAGAKHMARWERKRLPYYIALTKPGSDLITAPDANQES